MNNLSDNVSRYMTLCEEFAGIRRLGDTLYPTTWELEADLVVLMDKSKKDHLSNGTKAYQRMTFWLQSVLTESIFINAVEGDGIDISALVDNVPVYCPGEPTDDLIIKLIRSKLVAIAGSSMLVGQVRLKSKNMNVKYVEGDVKTTGLPTSIEYIKRESLYDVPWWNRPDGFTMEMVRWGDDTTESLKDIYADIEDPMTYADEMFDTGAKKEADIIEVSWTPKKA